MLFFIYRVDKPGTRDLRESTRPAHLEYARGLGGRLRLAGLQVQKADDQRAADRAEAEALTAEDPYEKAGLFETKIVRPFMEVPPWDLKPAPGS